MRFYHYCTDAVPGPWADDDENAEAHDNETGMHGHDLSTEADLRDRDWQYAGHGEWPKRLVVHRERIWGVHSHG